MPEELAFLNRTNINVQMMTILAAKERKMEYVYMAAALDPHTSAELTVCLLYTSLNITRNDLTGEGLRSLKFYGYYHSANVAAQATAEIIFKLISAYLSAEKTTVYLNAVNDGSINGLDTDAVVEIPFIFTDRKISREKVNLPLPCVLAIDDPAGAVIMTVKTLITKSATIFKRTIKLDPYLAPRLTLAELDDLAEGLLQHGGLKGLFKEE